MARTFRGKTSMNDMYKDPRKRECPHCGEREFPDIGHVFERTVPFMSFGPDDQVEVTIDVTCKSCKKEWTEIYEISKIRLREG